MILVTGASGFIGKNFVLALAAAERLRILARKTSRVDLFSENSSIDIAYGSLETGAGLDRALDGCDTVVHCAARTSGRDLGEFYRTNTAGTVNLLRAMEKKSVKKLLFLSSHAACGASAGGKPVDETCSAEPCSIYGITKKQAEDAVAGSKTVYTILRPCAVYGPHDLEILKYIRLLNVGVCPVIGSHRKYVNLVFVDDLVGLMLKIIKNNHFKGETFFVSDGRAYSYSEVFAEICKALGRRDIAPINIPFPAAMLFGLLNEIFLPERERVIDRNKIREMAMDSWLCSNAKAVNELGFKPEYTLANGMAKTIGWYRANGCL